MTERALKPGWKMVRFGDVVKLNTDRVADPLTSGIERYVGLEHITPEDLHIHSWGLVAEGITFTNLFKPGQVLFGKRRAYQRKVAVAEFEGVCSGDIYVLETKDAAVLLPELLPFLCQTEGFYQHAVGTSAGSLSPRTNWTQLAAYEFPLPPLNEQRPMADLLWAIYSARNENENLIRNTQNLIVASRENFFEGAKNWQKSHLGKLFEIKLGKMLSPKSKQGISPKPYMSNINVQWGRIDLSEIREMDFDNKEFTKNRLQYGDLLVCEGGEVGRSAIWRDELPECGYQKAIHRLRPRSDALKTEVLLQFMFYASKHGVFTKFTGQSTIAHLPAERLHLIEVPVPPKNNQVEFLNMLDELQKAQSLTEKRLLETKNLFNSIVKNVLGDI